MNWIWRLLNIVQLVGVIGVTVSTGVLGFSIFAITWNRDLQCRFTRTVWSPALLFVGGVRLKVEHEVPIPWDSPHVYVLNHQSAVDIPAAFIAIPTNLRFIAKAALRYVPMLGTYMAMTGMIFVDRSAKHRALRSMRKAAERIREGSNIIAFPEGTRSRGGGILPFKKGPFMLAIEAGVPVVPCAIEGGQHVLPPGFRIHPGTIRLKTGTPIPTAELQRSDRDRLIRQARNEVLRLNREIGGVGGVSDTPPETQEVGDDLGAYRS
ncbi:MAG: lysophospholipid acyltransferase family protein [Myxococcota bacterium]